MQINSEDFRIDLEYLTNLDYIEWEKFKEKTIFVTGGTGVIGFNIIIGLLYVNLVKQLDLKIIALVRNYDKALAKYSDYMECNECLQFVVSDVIRLCEIGEDINYIIHAASPTASNYFIENPVETIKTAVVGTMNILELAKKKNVEGVVFTSSMEVYGSPKTEDILLEENLGYMDTSLVRNCYPESKRLCENLCVSYASEYQIPIMSIRLAQTFGIGIDRNDCRVFAEFVKCIIEKKDITLLTDGKSKRCYLYTMDAVSAILTVLTKGEPGTVYNAGNPQTYCSIREMAEMVVNTYAKNECKIVISENVKERKKFPPAHYYNLGIERISLLGWKPEKNLKEMYRILLNEFGK